MSAPPVSTAKSPKVVVHVVTHNHAGSIAACVHAACTQRGFTLGESLFVHLSDNASSDGTAQVLQSMQGAGVHLHCHSVNLGFTGAHNKGLSLLAQQDADFLLLLNPDVALEQDCLAKLLEALRADDSLGSCVPKLLRADQSLHPLEPRQIDAAGMEVTTSCRHFDRGAEQLDTGQYDTDEHVFGGSGACILLRRTALEETAFFDGRYEAPQRIFADSFFAYREDAELAWRMQRYGWRCRYVAAAEAYHIRRVTPERRAALPEKINALGVQNRFLLQLLHLDLRYHALLLPTLWRNAVVFAACLSVERGSLPAFTTIARELPETLKQRRLLRRQERVPAPLLQHWFTENRSLPALPLQPQSPQPLKRISAIVVNYNSGERLHTCLSSLSAIRLRQELEVLIVDNASSDASASRAQRALSAETRFAFYHEQENLGFAGAINRAAREAQGEALLILNPDVRLDTEGLQTLVDSLEQHPRLSAAAPLLLSPDGSAQIDFSLRSFPKRGATLAELFLLHRLWPWNPWTLSTRVQEDRAVQRQLAQAQEQASTPVLVEQPPAACLLIRRSAYDEVSGFDANFWPAWFEDVDFCKRLSQRGLLVALVPSSTAVHEGGYSLEAIGEEAFRRMWFRNMRRYWRLHGTTTDFLFITASIPIALILRAALPAKTRRAAGSRTALLRAAWDFALGRE